MTSPAQKWKALVHNVLLISALLGVLGAWAKSYTRGLDAIGKAAELEKRVSQVEINATAKSARDDAQWSEVLRWMTRMERKIDRLDR